MPPPLPDQKYISYLYKYIFGLDLWLCTSYQIIVTQVCTHLPSMKMISDTVLELLWESSHFHLFFDLCDVWPLTLWLQNLIRSLLPQYVHIYQVWRWLVKRFLSYCGNELFSPIYWPLGPLTFDLMTPKSNQITVTPVCTHVPRMKLIRETVLELLWERAIFTYLLTSVTFDLWPCDPKI